MWTTKLATFSLLSLTAFGQFRLSKASVIIFPVTDLTKAVAFYRDQLGLPLSRTNEDFAFFDAGEQIAQQCGVEHLPMNRRIARMIAEKHRRHRGHPNAKKLQRK